MSTHDTTDTGDVCGVVAVDVAVVVVTHNSAELIPDLVTSLGPGLADLAWSLIVVDNASVDGTIDAVRHAAPDAKLVVTGRNGGYAAGINVGVTASPAHSAVLVLNPDVRLTPGCVASLLPALRSPGTGIAVPRLIDGRGQLIESQRREPTILRALADAVLGARRAGRYPSLGEVVSDPRRYELPTTVDWAEGSTLLISAACLQACGPWDERYFLYSEETEFALRARDAGFSTRFVPNATAVHLEGGSAGSPTLWPLLVTNRVRLYRSRHGPIAAAVFWAVVTLRETSRALIGNRASLAATAALVSPARMRATPGPDWIRPST